MRDTGYKDEFELILHSGNAKSKAMMAIEAARNRKYDEASRLLEDADNDLLNAHNIEKQLVVKEANGEDVPIGILMIHAQDHLMSAMLIMEEVNELIFMYKEIDALKKEVTK